MIQDLWWLCALFSGLATGVMIYANQIFKMPSSLMMCYRGVLMTIMLTPLVLFHEMPKEPMFWIVGIIQGLIIAYSDKKTFLCSRIYGGEITASIKPFVIAFVFIFWWLVKPTQLLDLLSTPQTFVWTIVCMAGIVFSLWLINRGSISKEAFILLFPALICAVIININNKYLTTLAASNGLVSAILWYTWLTALFAGLPNMIKFVSNRDWRLIFVPKYMLGGVVVVFCVLVGNMFKNTAMYYVSNPAYASALIALYPVWIIIWNKFYYQRKNAEKFPRCELGAVILLLTSVISLVLLQ